MQTILAQYVRVLNTLFLADKFGGCHNISMVSVGRFPADCSEQGIIQSW